MLGEGSLLVTKNGAQTVAHRTIAHRTIAHQNLFEKELHNRYKMSFYYRMLGNDFQVPVPNTAWTLFHIYIDTVPSAKIQL